MPLQDLTPLPAAPQRSDEPDVFIERADDFVAALPGLVTEINTLSDQLELTAAVLDAAPAYSDPGLMAFVGLTPAADKVPYWTGPTAASTMTVTAAARGVLSGITVSAMLTSLGIDTFAQDFLDSGDAAAMRSKLELTSAATATLSAFGATLIDDADAPAARTTLGAQAALTVTSNSNGVAIGIVIGGTTYYLQYGTKSVAVNSTAAVTFPVAFASTPVVVAGGGSSLTTKADQVRVYDASVSTTGCTLVNPDDADALTGLWIAIGA